MSGVGIFICCLAIIIGIVSLIGIFSGFIEEEMPMIIISSVIFLACISIIFIDKESGLVYRNVKEIQDILSYDNASEFTLARKYTKINIPYEDDDGNPKSESVEVSSYSLPVKGAKNIEVQDDIRIIRYSDVNTFSPALICTYKIISKGNFWYNESKIPLNDEISWYIQIPNSAHIKEVR